MLALLWKQSVVAKKKNILLSEYPHILKSPISFPCFSFQKRTDKGDLLLHITFSKRSAPHSWAARSSSNASVRHRFEIWNLEHHPWSLQISTIKECEGSKGKTTGDSIEDQRKYVENSRFLIACYINVISDRCQEKHVKVMGGADELQTVLAYLYLAQTQH